MSNQKRGRGERIWVEHADTVPEAPEESSFNKPRRQTKRKQYMQLRVECLSDAPYQFVVTNQHDDKQWTVYEGADGKLSLEERPDDTHITDRTVLAAIFQGWPNLRRQ